MKLNVTASAASPTEIAVSWVELSDICQNGVVLEYEIQYQPLQTFDVLMTRFMNVTAPAEMANLTGLEEYVDYNITVRAYTSVGAGPYSDPDTVTTFEDSKIMYSVSLAVFFYFYHPPQIHDQLHAM